MSLGLDRQQNRHRKCAIWSESSYMYQQRKRGNLYRYKTDPIHAMDQFIEEQSDPGLLSKKLLKISADDDKSRWHLLWWRFKC